MSKAKIYLGGCLCGHIRFEAKGPALNPHMCSCRMCQRHAGGLTVAWAEFARDAVTWNGPGGSPATYRSSANSRRAFCAKCGSSIGAIDDAPTIALLLGCFDTPNRKDLAPTAHSYRSECPGWWTVSVKST